MVLNTHEDGYYGFDHHQWNEKRNDWTKNMIIISMIKWEIFLQINRRFIYHHWETKPCFECGEACPERWRSRPLQKTKNQKARFIFSNPGVRMNDNVIVRVFRLFHLSDMKWMEFEKRAGTWTLYFLFSMSMKTILSVVVQYEKLPSVLLKSSVFKENMFLGCYTLAVLSQKIWARIIPKRQP